MLVNVAAHARWKTGAGRNQEDRGHGGRDKRDEVDLTVEGTELGKAVCEWDGEQERKEDLHSGKRHS